jgi:hypothetical protein
MTRYATAISLHAFQAGQKSRKKKPQRHVRGLEAASATPPRAPARELRSSKAPRLPAVIEETLPEEEDLEGWENEAEIDVEEIEEGDIGDTWEEEEELGDAASDAREATDALVQALLSKGASHPAVHPNGSFFFHLPIKAVPAAETSIRTLKKQYPLAQIRLLPLNFKQVRIEVRPKEEVHPARTTRLKQAGSKVREALTSPWGKPVALGPNLKVRARKGFRAAVVEVKPGLFVVAEVPNTSVEFGFGPLLLAPALVKTLGRVFQRRSPAGHGAEAAQRPGFFQQPPQLPEGQLGQQALPGPETEGLARWLDADVAAELGCARKQEEP